MSDPEKKNRPFPFPDILPASGGSQKTAFVFSGGGARGAYQVGVWQGLLELGIKPDIVTGTSVGAINAALVAQDSFDLAFHLWKQLDTKMVLDLEALSPKRKLPFEADLHGLSLEELTAYAKGFLLQGGVSTNALEAVLRETIDEERIRRSSIAYGLCTVELPVFRPHYLFIEQIPEGRLIDYILASSSCYPAIRAKEIDGVRYVDGAYADNMPVRMALDRGADRVIACNLDCFGFLHKEDWTEPASFILVESVWDLGNFLVFNETNAERIMKLGHLDCLKQFRIFDGKLYCMAKGTFPQKVLPSAELAGRFLNLDPSILYTRQSFDESLRLTAEKHTAVVKQKLRAIRTNRTNPGSLLESILNLLKETDRGTFVLLLAELLQSDSAIRTVLDSRSARVLLRDELAAARYLCFKNG